MRPRFQIAPKIQIFATDIDERGLETARKGRYPESIAEHVSPERLERFFIKQDGAYQVKREVRERCIFSNHSFIKDPPFSRLDLISCRNVMIYVGTGPAAKDDPALPLRLAARRLPVPRSFRECHRARRTLPGDR